MALHRTVTLFRRRRRYYIEHVETRRQLSLGTSNHAEAVRLWAARNEAAQAPRLNLALARTYLGAHDPRMLDRTWREVMEEIRRRTNQNPRCVTIARCGRRPSISSGIASSSKPRRRIF